MADLDYMENTDTYVEWNQLDGIGDDLINYSTTDIQNQIEKIQNLRKQVNWEGADAESSLKGFDEFMTEMGKVTQGVKQYGQFLKGVAGSYKDTSHKIQDKFETEIYQRKDAA